LIEDLLKNESFLRWVPLAAGAAFVVLFVSLGRWQLDRAAEKKALLALFEGDAPYTEPSNFDALDQFERIRIPGRYLADRQILIDNIPLDGRLGYYVITPLEPSTHDPLILVNRGWIPRPAPGDDQEEVAVASEFRTVRGLVGHLPRVAIRPGEAFSERENWPRVGLYPTADEIAAELGEDVLPFTLLLSPDDADGFTRRWQPDVSGPATHYGYAFQWFAMAVAVVIIAGWNMRKRYLDERA
jgi:surfeit locus 1 family protein